MRLQGIEPQYACAPAGGSTDVPPYGVGCGFTLSVSQAQQDAYAWNIEIYYSVGGLSYYLATFPVNAGNPKPSRCIAIGQVPMAEWFTARVISDPASTYPLLVSVACQDLVGGQPYIQVNTLCRYGRRIPAVRALGLIFQALQFGGMIRPVQSQQAAKGRRSISGQWAKTKPAQHWQSKAN